MAEQTAGSAPKSAGFSKEIRFILLASFVIMFISMGTRQGYGLFQIPITTDLGWGRADFSFAFALQNLLWGAFQPFTGAIADRYGPSRVVLVSGVLYVAGLVMMALPTSLFTYTAGAGVLIGAALSGTTFAVVLGAVGRMVPEHQRGKALGIAAAGGSAGQFLMIPASDALIGSLGWSGALLMLAGMAALMVPMAHAFTDKFTGGLPDAATETQSIGQAVAEAMKHPGFWLLTIGFYVCGFHVAFIAAHLPAFIVDQGLPPWLGAAALTLVGFFNILGTYGAGALGDKFRKKYLLSWFYLLRGVAFALFFLTPVTMTSVLLFGAAAGALWLGTVPLTTGLIAQIFGPRYMSTLFGIVFFSHQLGSFTGVWYGGYVFDTTGSYDHIWIAGIVLGGVAALLHAPIGDKPVARLSAPKPA